MAEDQIYLTVGSDPKDETQLLAVMSLGSPQMGDKNVEILTLETFDDGPEAKNKINKWFERMLMVRPWEEPKELEILQSEQVKTALADDPEAAEALRDFSATLRQAYQGLKEGKYETFEDAMEALTGKRPERVEDEDDKADSDD